MEAPVRAFVVLVPSEDLRDADDKDAGSVFVSEGIATDVGATRVSLPVPSELRLV